MISNLASLMVTDFQLAFKHRFQLIKATANSMDNIKPHQNKGK